MAERDLTKIKSLPLPPRTAVLQMWNSTERGPVGPSFMSQISCVLTALCPSAILAPELIRRGENIKL